MFGLRNKSSKTDQAESGVGQIVFGLAWPAVALNLLQTVNSLLDAKFVSALGKEALSASGSAMTITFLLISMAMAIGSGTTALVARFYGSGESKNLISASRQSTTLGLIIGIFFTMLAWQFVPFISKSLIGNDALVYQQFQQYIYPMLLGIPAIFIFITIASSLRAIGDTKRPLYVSGLEILVHIILNYFLMYPSHYIELFGNQIWCPGADMGIAGAGWSFTISAWFAVFAYFPVAGKTILGAAWKMQWIQKMWVVRILKIAGPAAFQAFIRVAGLYAFMAVLKYTPEGSDALGAIRVGFSMEAIAFMPAFGYMIAASTLVGQSLGMKDPDRAEKLAWNATNQGVLIMTLMSIIFLLFANQIAGAFVSDPGQREIAVNYLRIIAVTEPLFGYSMILTGAIQGAGDTVRPMIASAISLWLLRAPLAWICVPLLGGNSNTAWWIMSITQGINGFIIIWLFKKGNWKLQTV